MEKMVIINGVPHWKYEDGTLIRPIAGGQIPNLGDVGGPSPAFEAARTRALGRDSGFDLEAAFNQFLEEQRAAAASSGRTLGFGETRGGFEFQAAEADKARRFESAEARAAASASRLHDNTILGIQQEFTKAKEMRDNAFAKGERIEAQKWQERMQGLQQKFEAAEAEKGRTFQKEIRKEELKFERQRIFTEMLGKDPIRATLFAMGVGGETIPGGERFESLPPLKGAGQLEARSEKALSGLLGGRDIDIGEGGVVGLPGAVKAATSFQRGGAGAKSILSSAFGVGAKEGRGAPGINPEEFAQIIESVTPKGTLQ